MTRKLPRIFAGLLAAGGLFWAFVLVCLAFTNGWQSIFGVITTFGLGFAIWTGWIFRVFTPLGIVYRRCFWSASAGYNLFWLVLILQDRADSNNALLVGWWVIAVVLSLIALLLERREVTPNQSPQPMLACGPLG